MIASRSDYECRSLHLYNAEKVPCLVVPYSNLVKQRWNTGNPARFVTEQSKHLHGSRCCSGESFTPSKNLPKSFVFLLNPCLRLLFFNR